MTLTIVELPETEIKTTVNKGTVVYLDNKETELQQDWDVIIEERGSTNYNNQRRAIHPVYRTHMFWVQGQNILVKMSFDEVAKITGVHKKRKP